MLRSTAERLIREHFANTTTALPHGPVPTRDGTFTVWGEMRPEIERLIAHRHVTSRITGSIRRASHMPLGGWVLTADPRCVRHALGIHPDRCQGAAFVLPGPTVMYVMKFPDAGQLQEWVDILDGVMPVSWACMKRCGEFCSDAAMHWDERTIGWCSLHWAARMDDDGDGAGGGVTDRTPPSAPPWVEEKLL